MAMRFRGWITWLTLGAAAAITPTAAAQRSPIPQTPRLVVFIVVDQMRADYVDRFRTQWTSGLKRLVTGGAWFSNAAYPYLATLTCVGHATISTGALPYHHGIIDNSWFDRGQKRVTTCTEDRGVSAVAYGAKEGAGNSGVRLRVPSFADEMRAQRGSRVVTLAMKARSAVMLAGHGGDAVTWLSESLGSWETSSVFGGAVPAVKTFLDANSIDADYGSVWDRLLPPARYQFPDALDGEAPPRGWTGLFPHVLSSAEGKPDVAYHTQWERSPFADRYVGRFAAALAESMALGKQDTTDVLAVSFSSPDLVGHAFGPRSQEVQDMYARLDVTVGELLDRLDASVGQGGYVVALSADHGVAEIPEQLRASGRDGGRLSQRTLSELIEARAEAATGPGPYVATVNGHRVYFEPSMYEKLTAAPGAIESIIKALTAQPGIARVFRAEELANGINAGDALQRAASLSYVKGLSGDLTLALKPGWMFTATGTTHGTANTDDQRVPVILFGNGVKPGRYREAATPADIAPTLAALIGITMPNVDGRVLRSALMSSLVAPSTRP
jgi:predicted AlkP superfamily pyrophosphatase or phosphodiesterase